MLRLIILVESFTILNFELHKLQEISVKDKTLFGLITYSGTLIFENIILDLYK